MNLLFKSIRHLFKGTFILGLKNQPGKLRKWRWKRFLESKKQYLLFKYNNLYKIRLYKDSELSQYIFQKTFEVNETKFIHDFIKPGDRFIDVGTNIGFFSLLAAKRATEKGHVYSFEPTKKTYERLIENIELNKIRNITPIRKGVSNEKGFLEIHTSQDGYDAWNSFARPICGEIYNKENVEVIRMSDFIAETNLADNLALIKIDVEGWEKFVILGGEEFFKKNQNTTILIEFVDEHTRNAGYTCNELYRLLSSFGYTFYTIKNRKLEKEPLRDVYFYSNLVLTKNSALLKKRLKDWVINE